MALEYLANGICGSLTILFSYCLLCTLTDFRYSRKKTIIIFLCSYLFCAVTCITTYLTGFSAAHLRIFSLLVVLYFVVMGIVTTFIGKGIFSKKLFAVLFTIDVFLFIVSAAYVLSKLIFGKYTCIITEMAIRTVLFLAAGFISYKFARPVFIDDEFYHKTTWILFIVVALMFFGCISYINLHFGIIGSVYSREPVLALIVSVLMIITFVAMFYVFTLISKHNRRTNELNQMRSKNALLNTELDAQENVIYASKKLRHDVKHHLNVVKAYLDDGKIQEASDYLNEYGSGITDVMQEFSVNHIVNAIFRLYDEKCRKNGIDCSLFTDVPEKIGMDDTELCGLLSNILENAFDASSRCDSPSVSFRLSYENGRLCGYAENSASAPLVIKKGLPVSTKNGGGTGTKIINEIVNKYGGVVTFEKNGDRFITKFTLNNL